MTRFRPNLVVEGAAPFAEDTWERLRIGEVTFRQTEPCDRCVLTTIDPDTLDKGHEPTRTLARHRRRHGKVWFGIRLAPGHRHDPSWRPAGGPQPTSANSRHAWCRPAWRAT
jgi:uncharacterized protein